MSDQLLKIPEVADRLRVSRAFVYELMNAGALGSIHIGGARRVAESQLDDYIARLIQEDRERRKDQHG